MTVVEKFKALTCKKNKDSLIKKLVREFKLQTKGITILHVPRDFNEEAHSLAKQGHSSGLWKRAWA